MFEGPAVCTTSISLVSLRRGVGMRTGRHWDMMGDGRRGLAFLGFLKFLVLSGFQAADHVGEGGVRLIVDLLFEFAKSFWFDEAQFAALACQRFLGLKPVPGNAEDHLFVAGDFPGFDEFSGACHGDSASGFGKSCLHIPRAA